MAVNKTIKIEVNGGCVTEVTNLPDGYDYEIIDHDIHTIDHDIQEEEHGCK